MATADQLERMRDTVERSFVDSLVVLRPSNTVDAEGDLVGPAVAVAAIAGTVGDPTARDRETAGTPGERVDVILTTSLTADIRLGDQVDDRGRRWTVVTVRDTRFVRRVGLRVES